MINAIYCLILNILFAVALIFKFKTNGLALATTLSSAITTLMLFYKLIKDKIFIFTNDDNVSMPDLTNYSFKDARVVLEKLGIKLDATPPV